MSFVELSHTVEDGLVTYPGLPAPRVGSHLDRKDAEAHYAPGASFAIASIAMVGNTGTYVDAPYHRFESGADLAEVPLSSLADLEGVKVASQETAIGPEPFAGLALEGRAVLVETGWSRHWRSPTYLDGYPFLTRAAGEALVQAGAALVGIDSPNVDDNRDGERPVHTALLGAEIPIVEHLTNLASLPLRPFRFFAVPPPIRKLTSFPVRAFAIVTPA